MESVLAGELGEVFAQGLGAPNQLTYQRAS
jgi:hypothetical protein